MECSEGPASRQPFSVKREERRPLRQLIPMNAELDSPSTPPFGTKRSRERPCSRARGWDDLDEHRCKVAIPCPAGSLLLREATVRFREDGLLIWETTLPLEEGGFPHWEAVILCRESHLPLGESTLWLWETTLPLWDPALRLWESRVPAWETGLPLWERSFPSWEATLRASSPDKTQRALSSEPTIPTIGAEGQPVALPPPPRQPSLTKRRTKWGLWGRGREIGTKGPLGPPEITGFRAVPIPSLPL